MMNTRYTLIVLVSIILLLLPFIAMQFTDEVNWSFSDFAVAAVLIFGTGFLIEMVLRKIKQIKYRIVIMAALLFIFLLIWIELAVGIS